MATLAVSDNGDGTGGVATVSGSTGSELHTLYRSPWTGATGGYAWTASGTRTGNGTITLSSPGTIPLGLYLWQLVSATSGASGLVYRPLTAAAADTPEYYDSILTAVAATIRSLSLTGVDDVNVIEQMVPSFWEDVSEFPTILVTPIDKETIPGVMNNTDDIGYPVLVAMVDKGNQDVTTATRLKRLKWRGRIMRAFRFQRLSGVPEVMTCIPEPGLVVAPEPWQKNYWFSAIVFRFLTREPRGIST